MAGGSCLTGTSYFLFFQYIKKKFLPPSLKYIFCFFFNFSCKNLSPGMFEINHFNYAITHFLLLINQVI